MDIGVYPDEARATLRAQEERFRDIETKTGILIGATLALYGFSITAASSGNPAAAQGISAFIATLAIAASLFFAAMTLRVRDFDGAPMKWLGSHLGESRPPTMLNLAKRYRKLLEKNESTLQGKVNQLKRAQLAAGVGVAASASTLVSTFLTSFQAAAEEVVASVEPAGLAASPRVGECLHLLLQGGFRLIPQ